jgi:hypothetical protein
MKTMDTEKSDGLKEEAVDETGYCWNQKGPGVWFAKERYVVLIGNFIRVSGAEDAPCDG